jgi:hypothetical protein
MYQDKSVKEMMQDLKSKNLTKLYFDSTFCNSYCQSIPPRDDSIEFILKFIESKPKNQKIAISNDILGSEAILLSIADHFKTKIFVDVENLKAKRIFELKSLSFLNDIFTLTASKSRFMATSYQQLVKLSTSDSEYFCIRPSTMWSREDFKSSLGLENLNISKFKNNIQVRIEGFNDSKYIIYSMHSSFDEIKEFVEYISPQNLYSIRNQHLEMNTLSDLMNKNNFKRKSEFSEEIPNKKVKDSIFM